MKKSWWRFPPCSERSPGKLLSLLGKGWVVGGCGASTEYRAGAPCGCAGLQVCTSLHICVSRSLCMTLGFDEHVCVRACVCVCACARAHVHMCAHVCAHGCAHVCACACACVRVHTHVCVCVCAHVCVVWHPHLCLWHVCSFLFSLPFPAPLTLIPNSTAGLASLPA